MPDVELQDGDLIQLGNTTIRCVLTPGHTIGVMSHFWTLRTARTPSAWGSTAGLACQRLRGGTAAQWDALSLQQDFLSIDKWDEPWI